jgi:hypothetical protein
MNVTRTVNRQLEQMKTGKLFSYRDMLLMLNVKG